MILRGSDLTKSSGFAELSETKLAIMRVVQIWDYGGTWLLHTYETRFVRMRERSAGNLGIRGGLEPK